MLTERQAELIGRYVARYPHLAEIAERAHLGGDFEKELGDAMAVLPYPPGINGADALEIGRIGLKT